nr:zinc ribbon domain-containing protein [Pelagibacterium lentulum]
MNDRRRPNHLFAGLVKCGCRGGGYSMISKDLLGCATARNKGTCDNRLNIRRDALEASILNGLRKHLMEPASFREFCDELTKEVNRLRIERGADLEGWKHELQRVDRELDKIMDAILRFAAGKNNPDFLAEVEALDNLLAQSGASRKGGRRNAKTSAAGPTEVSQVSLVAGAGFEPATFRL